MNNIKYRSKIKKQEEEIKQLKQIINTLNNDKYNNNLSKEKEKKDFSVLGMFSFGKKEEINNNSNNYHSHEIQKLKKENESLKNQVENYKDKYENMMKMIEGDEEMENIERINYQLLQQSKFIKKQNMKIDLLEEQLRSLK